MKSAKCQNCTDGVEYEITNFVESLLSQLGIKWSLERISKPYLQLVVINSRFELEPL